MDKVGIVIPVLRKEHTEIKNRYKQIILNRGLPFEVKIPTIIINPMRRMRHLLSYVFSFLLFELTTGQQKFTV